MNQMNKPRDTGAHRVKPKYSIQALKMNHAFSMGKTFDSTASTVLRPLNTQPNSTKISNYNQEINRLLAFTKSKLNDTIKRNATLTVETENIAMDPNSTKDAGKLLQPKKLCHNKGTASMSACELLPFRRHLEKYKGSTKGIKDKMVEAEKRLQEIKMDGNKAEMGQKVQVLKNKLSVLASGHSSRVHPLNTYKGSSIERNTIGSIVSTKGPLLSSRNDTRKKAKDDCDANIKPIKIRKPLFVKRFSMRDPLNPNMKNDVIGKLMALKRRLITVLLNVPQRISSSKP